jgi:hypothetical protein
MLDPNPAVTKAGADCALQKGHQGRTKAGAQKRERLSSGRDWTKTVDENWPRFLKVWRPLIKLAEDQRREDRHRELPHVVYPR